MNGSGIQVVGNSTLELVHRLHPRISANIVELNDLFEMRLVTLADVILFVRQVVADGRHRPPPVKGSISVRQDKTQVALGLADPLPLLERSKRVGGVLQAVGGEDDIVGVVGNALEGGRLSQELDAEGCPLRSEGRAFNE
jgi:hypothetical protein